MSKQSDSSFFAMNDYRVYLRTWAKARGRGEFRRISLALGMHTTLVSQIMSGNKSLTEEQAIRLCLYMGLSPLETDYFLKLVQRERAGNVSLASTFDRHLEQLRREASTVKNRVPESKKMNEQDRAIFYSSWHYAAVRLLTSTTGFQTKEKIASKLDLSISRVQEILDFLVSRGLCNDENGKYTRTERNTHVEASSALAIRHHQNWRSRSLQLHEKITSEDLAFTAPVSLSAQDIPAVRQILLDAIAEVSKVVSASDSQTVAYLGIDWIKI